MEFYFGYLQVGIGKVGLYGGARVDEQASRLGLCASFLVWVSLGDSIDLVVVRGYLMLREQRGGGFFDLWLF